MLQIFQQFLSLQNPPPHSRGGSVRILKRNVTLMSEGRGVGNKEEVEDVGIRG